jgi:hypothetical protein
MDYKEIKVYLHTNLESLAEEKRTVLLESSLLHHPDIKNRAKFKKYPSISREATQNYGALSELDYQQKMEFFFSPESNLQLLRIFPNLFEKNEKKYNEEKNPKAYFKQYNNVIKKNIEIMLTLLFIASPLNAVNVTSSWEFVIDKLQVPRLPTVYGFFTGFSDTTLIDINSKKYSFDRIIWMNDILNCPVYSKLFLRYKSFMRWRENEYKKITAVQSEDDVTKAKDVIMKEMLQMNSAIENLVKTFKEYLIDISDPNSSQQYLVADKNIIAYYKLLCLQALYETILKVGNNTISEFDKVNLQFFSTRLFSGANVATQNIIKNAEKKKDTILDQTGPDFLKRVGSEYQKKVENVTDHKAMFINAQKEFLKILYAFIGKPYDATKNVTENDIYAFIKKEFSTSEISKLLDQLSKLTKAVLTYVYTTGEPSSPNSDRWKLNNFNSEKSIYQDIVGSDINANAGNIKKEITKYKQQLVDAYNESLESFDVLSSRNLNESDIKKKQTILDHMLKKTTKDIYDEYTKAGLNRDAQYSYFIDQYIRNQLSYQNKSTNRILQELINMQKNFEAERFFEFINRVYKYYYEGEGEPFKEGDDQTYWLYTGVNEKYESQSIENVWEIHVLCDLYLGVSGKLYGEKNCELKGEELGKNLELVLTENVDTLEKNRQKWDLNYRRILYSESGKQAERTEGNRDNDGSKGFSNNDNAARKVEAAKVEARKPDNKNAPTNLNPQIFQQIIDDTEEERKKEHDDETKQGINEQAKKEKFNQQYPPAGTADKNKQIDKLWYPNNSVAHLTEINSYFRNHANLREGQPDFQKSNLLGILHDSKNQYERQLYEAYAEFNVQQFRYNRKVIEKFTDLESLLSGQIKSNRRRQEEFLRTQNAETSEQFLKFSLLCAKYFFYMKIIERLIKLEDKKDKLNAISIDTPMGRVAAQGGKKRYKTYRRKKEKRAITRKTKYLRRRN